jgi:hypothetical protein
MATNTPPASTARNARLPGICSTGPLDPSFVDLAPIFQYSRVLARCCAWGQGVLTRTGQ